MLYYHESNPDCHELFDSADFPNRDGLAQSLYLAGETCPKCKNPFQKPVPATPMLFRLTCKTCGGTFFTDVFHEDGASTACPLPSHPGSRMGTVELHDEKTTSIPQRPTPVAPALRLRVEQEAVVTKLESQRPISPPHTSPVSKKPKLGLEDLLRYLLIILLVLLVALPFLKAFGALLLGTSLGLLALMIFCLFLPFLVYTLLTSMAPRYPGLYESLEQAIEHPPRITGYPTSAQGALPSKGSSPSATSRAIGQLDRRRRMLTNNRVIFLLGVGVGILLCYVLSKVLEETRQTLQQMVEMGTLSVALFGVLVYGGLYFITLNEKLASFDRTAQGIALAVIVGLATIVTLVLIPALLGQPLSDGSVAIGIIINVIGSVITTVYVIVSNQYWKNTVI
jgi:uncharacterized membrane protein (DUF485 family)